MWTWSPTPVHSCWGLTRAYSNPLRNAKQFFERRLSSWFPESYHTTCYWEAWSWSEWPLNVHLISNLSFLSKNHWKACITNSILLNTKSLLLPTQSGVKWHTIGKIWIHIWIQHPKNYKNQLDSWKMFFKKLFPGLCNYLSKEFT